MATTAVTENLGADMRSVQGYSSPKSLVASVPATIVAKRERKAQHNELPPVQPGAESELQGCATDFHPSAQTISEKAGYEDRGRVHLCASIRAWHVQCLSVVMAGLAWSLLLCCIIKVSIGQSSQCESEVPGWRYCSHRTYPPFGGSGTASPCNCRVYVIPVDHLERNASLEDVRKEYDDTAASLPVLTTIEVFARTFFGDAATHPFAFDLPFSKRHEHLRLIVNDNSQVTSLPKALGAFKKLEMITWGYNEVETMPPELAWLPNLRAVSLTSSKIKDIPEVFAEATHWSGFHLTGTPFCEAYLKGETDISEGIQRLVTRLEACKIQKSQKAQDPESIPGVCISACSKIGAYFDAVDGDSDGWVCWSEMSRVSSQFTLEQYEESALQFNYPETSESLCSSWFATQAILSGGATNCAECSFSPSRAGYPPYPPLQNIDDPWPPTSLPPSTTSP